MGVFLDGEFYLNKMDAPATLRELQRTRVIPPMTCAFVSHRDEVARHNDLTCNARFAEFIATDVVRWLRGKEEGLPVEGQPHCGHQPQRPGFGLPHADAANRVFPLPEPFGIVLVE
ncbi:MAG: hypothetical protein WDO13_16315 [Verrucomicrobiota bacterium]